MWSALAQTGYVFTRPSGQSSGAVHTHVPGDRLGCLCCSFSITAFHTGRSTAAVDKISCIGQIVHTVSVHMSAEPEKVEVQADPQAARRSFLSVEETEEEIRRITEGEDEAAEYLAESLSEPYEDVERWEPPGTIAFDENVTVKYVPVPSHLTQISHPGC